MTIQTQEKTQKLLPFLVMRQSEEGAEALCIILDENKEKAHTQMTEEVIDAFDYDTNELKLRSFKEGVLDDIVVEQPDGRTLTLLEELSETFTPQRIYDFDSPEFIVVKVESNNNENAQKHAYIDATPHSLMSFLSE